MTSKQLLPFALLGIGFFLGKFLSDANQVDVRFSAPPTLGSNWACYVDETEPRLLCAPLEQVLGKVSQGLNETETISL